jgi:hypothetical protein
VRRNIQRSTNNVLGVVLLIGWLVFTGAAAWIAAPPVSVSI